MPISDKKTQQMLRDIVPFEKPLLEFEAMDAAKFKGRHRTPCFSSCFIASRMTVKKTAGVGYPQARLRQNVLFRIGN